MDEILKEKIRQSLKERKAFWEKKSDTISNSLKTTKRMLNEENSKIFEEITDIDREIKSLETVIKNSSDLASSLIRPVKERERCIENMLNTKIILELEKKIKLILAKIKNERDFELKIKLILEANELIKQNTVVFNDYRELVLNESKDVVSHLTKLYEEKIRYVNDILNQISIRNKNKNNENSNEITGNTSSNVDTKEISQSINSLDKTSILIYKLTLEKRQMDKYFESVLEFIVKLVSGSFVEEIEEKLKQQNKPETLSAKVLEKMLKGINYIIESIFIKLVSIIKKRQQIYFQEFSNFNLVFINISVFFCNLEKYLDKFLSFIYQINELLNKMDVEGKQLDFLCYELSLMISNFEKFKFFVSVLQEKIYFYNHDILTNPNSNNNNINSSNPNSNINLIRSNSNNININNINLTTNTINLNEEILNYKSNLSHFLKKFNSYLYDLGEKYANYEIKFIKLKLLKIFKDEAKQNNNLLESNLKKKFEEFSTEENSAIEDFFFVLKLSGERAIETKNTQLSMAIINNIKSILFDELLEIFDHKLSAVLIKSEFRNKNFQNELKYLCKDEAGLSAKSLIANLFLVFCFNAIDDAKTNVSLLFEFFKNQIHSSIFNSDFFDHKKINLFTGSSFCNFTAECHDNTFNFKNNFIEKEESYNEKIKYFHKSEIDLINHLFGEVDQLEARYEEFLSKKIKLLFEFLHPTIKASVDMLNSANYTLDSRKINSVDFVDSFANKFIEETEKVLAQWKTQMAENCFNKFALLYCDYVAQFMEMILILKKYNTFGIILLEKVKKIEL